MGGKAAAIIPMAAAVAATIFSGGAAAPTIPAAMGAGAGAGAAGGLGTIGGLSTAGSLLGGTTAIGGGSMAPAVLGPLTQTGGAGLLGSLGGGTSLLSGAGAGLGGAGLTGALGGPLGGPWGNASGSMFPMPGGAGLNNLTGLTNPSSPVPGFWERFMAGDFNSKLDKAQKVGGRLQSFLDTQEPDEDQTINQPHAPMPDFDPQKSSSLASAAPKRGATIPGRTARSLDFFGNRRDEEKDSYARALARYGEFT